METIYAKVNKVTDSLEQRVNKAAEQNLIDECLSHELCYARRADLNWDIFYKLLDIPAEQQNGYWIAAKVASTLLEPVISIQFFKNKNARINERMDDDFLSEVIMEIARVIPSYSREKSEFPHFIKLYIQQCGYVHNKDYSVYMQKKNKIRIFSQNGFADKKDSDSPSTGDCFENVAAPKTIEEEIERKEILRKNAVFQTVVVNKVFSSKEDQITHANAQQLVNLQNEARLLRMTDKDNRNNANQGRIEGIERLLEDKTSKDTLAEDNQKTIVNACLWHKFLGGVNSYDDLFIQKIVERLSDDTGKSAVRSVTREGGEEYA